MITAAFIKVTVFYLFMSTHTGNGATQLGPFESMTQCEQALLAIKTKFNQLRCYEGVAIVPNLR